VGAVVGKVSSLRGSGCTLALKNSRGGSDNVSLGIYTSLALLWARKKNFAKALAEHIGAHWH